MSFHIMKKMNPQEFKRKSVHTLSNIGQSSTNTRIGVECLNPGNIVIDKVKKWIQGGECEKIIEGPFHGGVKSLSLWKEAFPGFKKHTEERYNNTFKVFYDNGETGPLKPSLSISVSKSTVELEDGEELDNIFYIKFNQSAGRPEQVMIMRCNK